MDREYQPVSMRSKYPDTFQRTHHIPEYVDADSLGASLLNPVAPVTEPEPDIDLAEAEEQLGVTPTDTLEAKTIRNSEGQAGFSYKSLFGDYLKGATSIHLADPYVRLEYQVRNFLGFTGIIDTVDGPVELLLTTSSEYEYQQKVNSQKFDEIAKNLAEQGINFKYEFSATIHRRGIELDNGWRIIADRGLDIYQKPESKYELGEMDQTKRKCRETEIIFIKEES